MRWRMIKMSGKRREAAILAKNEQLRANLLRTISHDLRTPLTSISGNANNLLYNESCLDAQMRRRIYGDIYDDSMWLIDLVENLLSVTRIEEGRMQIRQSAELVDEVIREALKHTGQSRTGRTIKVEEEDELIPCKDGCKADRPGTDQSDRQCSKVYASGNGYYGSGEERKRQKTEKTPGLSFLYVIWGMGSRMTEKKEYLTCFILAVIRWQTAAGA